MKTIRVALIGFGVWSQEAYSPLLKELHGVQVVAVAARSEKTLALARKTFGEEIDVTTDYAKLLEDDDVDAVMIAVPNALHAEVLLAAAESNKHVFFEPPIAHDPETAQRILGALHTTEGIVQADLELRCLPMLEAIRAQMTERNPGSPRMAKIRLWCNWGYQGGPWIDEVQEQSFFHWLGHWYLDVLDVVFGETATRATVFGGRASNGTLMDYGWASLEYPGRSFGQFEFNLTLPQDTLIELVVACESGEILADLKTGRWKWRGETAGWHEEHSPASEPVYGFEGMRESIADFFTAIRTGKSPRANLEVVRRVQHAAQLCAASRVELM
jgi:predicted dehydrogenase